MYIHPDLMSLICDVNGKKYFKITIFNQKNTQPSPKIIQHGKNKSHFFGFFF